MLRLNSDEKRKLDEQDSVILNPTLTSPKMIKEIPTKSYVDSLDGTNRNRRVLSPVYKDQDKEFVNNETGSLDSITVKKILNWITN